MRVKHLVLFLLVAVLVVTGAYGAGSAYQMKWHWADHANNAQASVTSWNAFDSTRQEPIAAVSSTVRSSTEDTIPLPMNYASLQWGFICSTGTGKTLDTLLDVRIRKFVYNDKITDGYPIGTPGLTNALADSLKCFVAFNDDSTTQSGFVNLLGFNPAINVTIWNPNVETAVEDLKMWIAYIDTRAGKPRGH